MGHNLLSTYCNAVGFCEEDYCVCGVQGTVVTHVLVDCPILKELRRGLRRKVGDAFNSVSSLLGDSNEGERGKPDSVLPADGNHARLRRGVTAVLRSRATRAA
jgi:hypothetical protein